MAKNPVESHADATSNSLVDEVRGLRLQLLADYDDQSVDVGEPITQMGCE